jgi:hypothetical protein
MDRPELKDIKEIESQICRAKRALRQTEWGMEESNFKKEYYIEADAMIKRFIDKWERELSLTKYIEYLEKNSEVLKVRNNLFSQIIARAFNVSVLAIEPPEGDLEKQLIEMISEAKK